MPLLDLAVLAQEPAADATFKKPPKVKSKTKKKPVKPEYLDFDT
jgi:hypothetical protein